MVLYLSRVQLTDNPSVKALDALIDPSDRGERRDAHHRLIWSLFAGDPEATRDFLWRSEGRGRFIILSQRPPVQAPLFDRPETKEFDPDLQAGDRLAFALRANPTRTEKTGELSSGGRERKRHIDLVMDALKPVPREARANMRMKVAQEAGARWLEAQGGHQGFAPDHIAVGDYSVSVLPGYRGRRLGQPQFGIVEMTGILTVTDPSAFLAALARGFGRAKAFGCGLMLIRRAPSIRE